MSCEVSSCEQSLQSAVVLLWTHTNWFPGPPRAIQLKSAELSGAAIMKSGVAVPSGDTIKENMEICDYELKTDLHMIVKL